MKNIIKELFLESVNLYPENGALEIGGQTYSYKHLAKLVQAITNTLQEQDIRGKAVVVLNDHSIYTYASLLAINFSGNTILPVEATWPKQRVENILGQAKPAAFINTRTEVDNGVIDLLTGKLKAIDAATGFVIVSPEIMGNEPVDYNDIAYIIFTSGTTGAPKGVPVKQESLNAFISYYKEHYDFAPSDRFLQVYELTFDVAYFSFLVPICCGACCCILSSKKGVPKYLFIVGDLIKREITVVSMVPTVLHFIKKYLKSLKAPSVRYSFFSGDALYHSDAVKWQEFVPNAAIHNFYGPTETTIVCTRYLWDKDTEESYNDIVPLGMPFPGMHYKIVDEQNNELEEGKVGELSFCGVQVIDAYLNTTNAEKFFEVEEIGQYKKYYKTGDLASVNEKGNLVFHGRADLQVKINGYRIELEEVELALQKVVKHKSIVVKKRSKQNADYLKAYVEGEEQNIDKVKSDLLHYLPDYMIPAQFEFIEQIPLSENGKIDKAYLQSI